MAKSFICIRKNDNGNFVFDESQFDKDWPSRVSLDDFCADYFNIKNKFGEEVAEAFARFAANRLGFDNESTSNFLNYCRDTNHKAGT